jgi:glycosyltransferase involved in cell wall biosynthesis
VADSICGQLFRYSQHRFIVVLSKHLVETAHRIEGINNVEVYRYDIPTTFRTVVLGRDKFLDRLVEKINIDAVLTVFGPSRWRPKVPHLSGFALPQLVIPESPFFQRMGKTERIKWWLWCLVRKWSLKRSSDLFWTENSYISRRLELLYNQEVHTITNYYNQVFDQPERWKRSIKLSEFDGVTCLSISSPSSHKNFGIIEDVVRYLRQAHPNFKVRFVLTLSEQNWPMAEDVRDSLVYVGKIDVSECPNLYEQADIMFMPTLLECFTATYPEAMRMEVPIVTTDLEFARGLCGEAACYYSAVDAKAAAEAIYKVATDEAYRLRITAYGKGRLKKFDNYEQRAEKLVHILEGMVQP